MQERAKQNLSPFSPAQRAMLDTVSSGGSEVMMEVGRTFASNEYASARQSQMQTLNLSNSGTAYRQPTLQGTV